MKIIVDEIPKTADKCIFSQYNYGYHECKLTKECCELDCHRNCEMLLKAENANLRPSMIEPVKDFYYKGQQLYVKKGATNGEINKKR